MRALASSALACATSLSLAVALFCAAPSHAANAVFPSLRLDPSIDVDGIGNAQWAGVPDAWGWDAALWLGYEKNSLFTFDQTAVDPLTRERLLLQDRFTADVVAALAIANWVQLGVDVPVVLAQDGASKLTGFGFGDITLSPKIRVLRQQDGAPFDLAVLAPVTFPSGQFIDYAGETGLTIAPGLAASHAWTKVRTTVNLTHRFRDVVKTSDLIVGNELLYKVGISYAFDVVPEHPTEVGLVLSGAAATDNLFRGGSVPFVGADPSAPGRNPVELILDVQHPVWGDLDAFVGAGGGIISGYGVPDFRAYAGLRFHDHPAFDYDGDGIVGDKDKCPHEAENVNGFEDTDGCPDADDTDHDGIRDDKDKCINDPEDKDGFQDDDGCPDNDNDNDGIPDSVDKCPNVAEDKDGFQDDDGCPDPDNDGDGIPDTKDKCPNQAEDKDGFQDDDGCPDLDNDADGIADKDDQCPNEAGPKANHGCPDKDRDHDGVVDRFDNCPDEPGPAENGGCAKKQLVVITEAKLEIKDKVYFDTDKDTIQPKSFELLENIAAVLKAHPEIKKIRVEGHTDNVGKPDHNKDLSDRRAKSVRKYLIDKGGIEAARLDALGFGEDRPIATNDNADGKAQNRRVEFLIVDDATEGAPAPTP